MQVRQYITISNKWHSRKLQREKKCNWSFYMKCNTEYINDLFWRCTLQDQEETVKTAFCVTFNTNMLKCNHRITSFVNILQISDNIMWPAVLNLHWSSFRIHTNHLLLSHFKNLCGYLGTKDKWSFVPHESKRCLSEDISCWFTEP